MNGRFKIYLRRRQNQFEGNNVTVQCNPTTGYAEYVPGTVDNTTPFAGITPVGGWYDFTPFVEDVEKLSFTWDKVNSGNSTNTTTNQDGSNYDKGLTSDLMFFDSAYQFIADWLIATECQILNAVEVKVTDLIAGGTYRVFEIKNDNIEYAPVDEPCQFHIKLREQDNNWHCIHKTFIWDNWQNWFKDDSTKEHPCFLTCIEPRPRLVHSVRMALLIFFRAFLDVILLFTGPVGILLKNWVFNNLDNEGFLNSARRVLNANRFVDAPLIKTYVENVAGKCGLTTDTIFDAGQEWENLSLYYPQAGYMHESDEEEVVSPSLAYHFDNRWLITIAELFDKLKTVFAAEWYVTPLNKIVFKHTKDLINLSPIYDFTAVGAEAVYDLRYTFNGTKKPAYGRYQYQDDGSDLASQEMSTLYSDIIDYDGPANNPMLEGERLKNFEFAPTGFIRDGRAKDYLELLIRDGQLGAIILVIILAVVIVALFLGALTVVAAAILLGFFWAWVGAISIKFRALMNEFVYGPTYSGAVRLTSEQVLTPRLILWDGLNMERAKTTVELSLPAPSPFYNPDLVPYDQQNNINVNNDNPFRYVFNYPMYFDGSYTRNLFDKYHDRIDNPFKSLESHQEVKFNVDLCEGMLNLFGVFENQYAVIGKIIKLETRENYDIYARIGNINVDYDNNKINIKGTVLRQPRVGEELPGELPDNTGVIVEDPVFVVPGGEPPQGEVITPCLRWKNDSLQVAEGVVYVDCEGNLVQTDLMPAETFCAISINDLGVGGNIIATNTCDEESGSGEESGGDCCLEVTANEGLTFETTEI